MKYTASTWQLTEVTYFQSTRCQCPNPHTHSNNLTVNKMTDMYFTVTHLLQTRLQIIHSEKYWCLLLPTRQRN